MGIRIIVDSTSDISADQASRINITIVPLKVIFGDKEYREGEEISIDEFYEKLVKSESLPTTSQPAPDDFLRYFKEAKSAGDKVIVLVIGSKLSGTFQSAVIAKEMVDYEDIYVIDSKTSTCSLRILVERAVDLRDKGVDAQEIVAKLMDLKERTVLIGLVDTLEYLHKGGRLSKSSALIGTLLKFKPIIALKDGTIGLIAKERGVQKGITRLIEAVSEMGEVDMDFPVYLGYAQHDDRCKRLREKLASTLGLSNITMYPVGCVIGTHVGPGACILTYVKK